MKNCPWSVVRYHSRLARAQMEVDADLRTKDQLKHYRALWIWTFSNSVETAAGAPPWSR
jgi:hypothetical protein